MGSQRAHLRRRVHAIHRALWQPPISGRRRRVLDVGCGTGTLLAAAVAARAEAVGVDIAPAMVDAAQMRVPSATVITADAQTADILAAAPGEPFDRVVSRFGVMFFVEPDIAFANIRRRDGARRTDGVRVLAWRRDRHVLARPHHAQGAPGRSAGAAGPGCARSVGLARCGSDSSWCSAPVVGRTSQSSRSTASATTRPEAAMASRNGWPSHSAVLLAELCAQRSSRNSAPSGWEAAVDEARADLRERLVDGALRFVAHTWLVTATNRP